MTKPVATQRTVVRVRLGPVRTINTLGTGSSVDSCDLLRSFTIIL